MAKRAANHRLTKARALALAQKYLDRHQPRAYRLVAQAGQTEFTDGRWYVQVDPVPENANTSDFSKRMVEALMELQQVEGVAVELTSMLPRDVLSVEMMFPRLAQALSANGKRKSA